MLFLRGAIWWVLIRLFSYLLPLLGSNILLGLICGCGVIQRCDFVGSGRKGRVNGLVIVDRRWKVLFGALFGARCWQ